MVIMAIALGRKFNHTVNRLGHKFGNQALKFGRKFSTDLSKFNTVAQQLKTPVLLAASAYGYGPAAEAGFQTLDQSTKAVSGIRRAANTYRT